MQHFIQFDIFLDKIGYLYTITIQKVIQILEITMI